MAPVVSRVHHDHLNDNRVTGDTDSGSRTRVRKLKSTWQDVDSRSISPPASFKNSFSSSQGSTNSSLRPESTSPSPSLKSTHSNKSSHSGDSSILSGTGDSGVSSERDSPSPHEPSSFLTTVSSDSEDDLSSNISTDSLHDEPQHKSKFTNHPFYPLKSPKSPTHVHPKKELPNVLLRQICERAQLFELRRQNLIDKSIENSNLAMLRGMSIRRPPPPSKLHHTSSFSSSSSLLSSSVYSSMTSLYEDEVDDLVPQRPMSVCEEGRTSSPNSDLFEVEEEKNASIAFAGIRDIFSPPQKSTIRSQKGTVRGVRNRVRAGIATFTSDQRLLKLYKERERGRVVVFLTTLGIVRHTYERCQKIKKILWTLSVRFDERDVFMNRDTQLQLLDRLDSKVVSLPHVFLDGQYLGDADVVELLNESGELKRLLQPYRVPGLSTSPCDSCGGFRMLPCPVCNGSKKSLNRNHFTLEFVALKCCCCDEAGLVRCQECGG